jgi:low affinity Fe/Cu permease
MDQNTLLILLIIFVALAAIAMFIQAVMLIGMFLVARKLQEKILPIIPEVEKVIGVVRRTVESIEKHVEKIGVTSGAILDVTKQQLVKVDELLSDASTRAKVQMERAEMVLDDTMTRVQETVSVVQRGVIRPVREIQGVLSGFRSALAYLGRGRRPTVDHATSDEEMFI